MEWLNIVIASGSGKRLDLTWVRVDGKREPGLHVHLVQPVGVRPVVQVGTSLLEHLGDNLDYGLIFLSKT